MLFDLGPCARGRHLRGMSEWYISRNMLFDIRRCLLHPVQKACLAKLPSEWYIPRNMLFDFRWRFRWQFCPRFAPVPFIASTVRGQSGTSPGTCSSTVTENLSKGYECSQSGTSPGTCSSTGDQASRNTRNSYSYIWSNQDQDDSFLFIYIHLLLSLLFSKVININQSEEITSDFTSFLSVI